MKSFELFRDTLGGTVLGIEIDREYIQYLLLEKKPGKFLVHNFGRFMFKDVTDVSEGLHQTIPMLFGKNTAFKNAKLILGIAEEGLHLKTDSMPPLGAKELEQSILMDIQREMGAEGGDASDIVYGYKKMGPDKKKAGHTEYLAVGLYEEDLNKEILPFVLEGVVPVKVTPRLLALSNLIQFLPQESTVAPTGILHIGAKRSVLAIYKEGKLDFHRDIVMGSDDFVKAITGTIFHEGKAIQFTFEEAVEIKNRYGYPMGYEDGQSFKGAPVSELGAMMRPVMERLTGEIQRSLGFYADKTDGESAQSLYLVGNGANMNHLDDVLTDRLNVKVAKMAMPKNCVVTAGPEAKKMFKHKFVEQVICLALASETDKHSANLLPKTYKQQAQLAFLSKAALGVAAIILAFVLGSSALKYIEKGKLESDKVFAEKRALEAEQSEQRFARGITRLGKLNEELSSLRLRVLQDEDLVQILRLFSKELPNDLYLTSFNYEWQEVNQAPKPQENKRKRSNAKDDEEAPPPIPKRFFNITGTSNNPPADVKILIAGFIIDMQKSGYFSEIDVVSEALNPDGDQYEFVIKGILAG